MRTEPRRNNLSIADGISMVEEIGPPEDPYANLSGVQFLDEKLEMLDRSLGRLRYAVEEETNLTSLQNASLELIPAASSLGKSVRKLIKEGYLVSALVLYRPLMERVATLAYLQNHGEAISLWEAGWPHGQRPSLATRLSALIPASPGAEQHVTAFIDSVRSYNGLVHGDPLAGKQSRVLISDRRGYALDRDYLTPGRAHGIAFETAIAIVFLIVLVENIFPGQQRS